MIIGIGGLSRSGKTSVAKRLRAALKAAGHKVLLLQQDLYPQKIDLIPMIKDRRNWESPESIDWISYRQAIDAGQPDYDHIISEGLFAFYDQAIEELYDKRVVVHIDKTTFLERKATDTRWGPVPPLWYQDHIWDSHQSIGQCASEEVYRIDGRKPFKVEALIAYLAI